MIFVPIILDYYSTVRILCEMSFEDINKSFYAYIGFKGDVIQ